jgi:hypothetical protein
VVLMPLEQREQEVAVETVETELHLQLLDQQ